MAIMNICNNLRQSLKVYCNISELDVFEVSMYNSQKLCNKVSTGLAVFVYQLLGAQNCHLTVAAVILYP